MNQITTPPVLISVASLLLLAGALVLVAFVPIPPAAEAPLNILLGTISAMAGAAVNYWLGSSAGSARKTEIIEARDHSPTNL